MVSPLRPDKLPLNGYTVMLNSGHGAFNDKGAAGRLNDGQLITEEELNDKTALNVKRKLELLGANVVYLDNLDVMTIWRLENKIKPDIFVSIHQNSNKNKSYRGETLYAVSDESLKAANFINERFKADDIIPNNKINREISEGLWVLNADKGIPAVLVEVGYISNSTDVEILNLPQYQNLSAQFIVDGIRDFFRFKKDERRQKEVTEDAKLNLLFEQITNPFGEFFQNSNAKNN